MTSENAVENCSREYEKCSREQGWAFGSGGPEPDRVSPIFRAPVRADVSGIGLNSVRVGLTYRVGLSRSARLFSLENFFFHLRQIDDEISCYILVIHYDDFKSF